MPIVSIAQPPYVPLAIIQPATPPEPTLERLIVHLTLTETGVGEKTNEFLYTGFPMAANALAADETLTVYDDDGSGGKGAKLANFQLDNLASDLNGKRRWVSIAGIAPSLGHNATRKLGAYATTAAVPSGTPITKTDLLALPCMSNGAIVLTLVVAGVTYTCTLLEALGGAATFAKTAACDHGPWRSGSCLLEEIVSAPFRSGGVAHAGGDGFRGEFHLKAWKAGVGPVSPTNPILCLKADVTVFNGWRAVSVEYLVANGSIQRAVSLVSAALTATNDTDAEGRTVVNNFASAWTHWGQASWPAWEVWIGAKPSNVIMLGDATATGGTAKTPTGDQLLDYLNSTGLFPFVKKRLASIDHTSQIAELNLTSRAKPMQFSGTAVGGAGDGHVGNHKLTISDAATGNPIPMYPDRGVISGWNIRGVTRYDGDGRRLIFENARYLATRRTIGLGLNYGSATQRYFRPGDVYPADGGETAGDPYIYDPTTAHECELAYTAYLLTGDYCYYHPLNARAASYGGYANVSSGLGQNMTWLGDWSKGGQWADHYTTGGDPQRWIKSNELDRSATNAIRSIAMLGLLCPDRMATPNLLSWDKAWSQTWVRRHWERYKNVITDSTGPLSTYNRFGVAVMRYFTDFGAPWQQPMFSLSYHGQMIGFAKSIGMGDANLAVALDWLARYYTDLLNATDADFQRVVFGYYDKFSNVGETAPILTIADYYRRLVLRNPLVSDEQANTEGHRWNFAGTATLSAQSGAAVTVTLPQARVSPGRADHYTGGWFCEHTPTTANGPGAGQITGVVNQSQITINTTVAGGAAFSALLLPDKQWSLPPPASPEDKTFAGQVEVDGDNAVDAEPHYVDALRAALAMLTHAQARPGIADAYALVNAIKPDVEDGQEQFDLRPGTEPPPPPPPPPPPFSATLELFEFVDFTVNAPSAAGNLYDVVADVVWTHSEGATRTGQAFYSGTAKNFVFRFGGALAGAWTGISASSVPELNGKAFVLTVVGSTNALRLGWSGDAALREWGQQKGNSVGLTRWLPMMTMWPALPTWQANQAVWLAFLSDHGWNGVHITGLGISMFDATAYAQDGVSSGAWLTGKSDPDPVAFANIETMIRTLGALGVTTHWWMWTDDARAQTWNQLTGGLNGAVHQRLIRYLCARLSPVPGWIMGVGFDIDEWISQADFSTWLTSHTTKFGGYHHYIGGRFSDAGDGAGSVINSGGTTAAGIAWNTLDSVHQFASWEQHENLTSDAELDTVRAASGRPAASEDRFIRRDTGAAKDFAADSEVIACLQRFASRNYLAIYSYLVGRDIDTYANQTDTWPNAATIKTTIQNLISGAPVSQMITDVSFDFGSHIELAPGSDIWPITWADDDHQYVSWGDGGGFGGTNTIGRVSLGFGRVEGPANAYSGFNVWGGLNPENPAQFPGKCCGILSVNGVLYAWVMVDGQLFAASRLYFSTNHGATWTDAGFGYSGLGGAFTVPTFLQAGQDYGAAQDGYVYTYAPGEKPADFSSTDEVYLARVPVGSILTQSAYEYFTGLDVNGNPQWSSNVANRQPAFSDPGNVHWMVSVGYVPGLSRYVLFNNRTPNPTQASTASGDLDVWEAPKPWGPWTLVRSFTNFGGLNYTFSYYIGPRWISSDGKSFTLVFSGTGGNDSWNTVNGTFSTDPVAPPPPPPAGPNEQIPPVVTGNIARIGTTEYATMQAAHNAAASGATINVLPGRHQGTKCHMVVSKPLTVIGILDSQNRRPFLDVTGITTSKGIFNPSANMTIENIGFMGANNGNNAAGIWGETAQNSLTCRWCMFTKCNNGVLTPQNNFDGTYLFEDCVSLDNGYGNLGQTHNYYFGGSALVTIRRGSTRLPNRGHALKSRAVRMVVEDVFIQESTTSSRAIDYSNGGDLYVNNCHIVKPSGNGQQDMIAIWPENQQSDSRLQQVLIENSILDGQRSPTYLVNNSYRSVSPCVVRNCTFPNSTSFLGPVTVE